MTTMTTLEASNWVMNNPNSVGDAIPLMQIAERGMADLPPDSQAYGMHKQTYDHNMQRVVDARAQAEAEQAQMDTEAAKATCDCQPGEPCCLTSGEVWDSTSSGRKITWPITNDESKLYVIAKDVEGTELIAKVKSKVVAIKDCTAIQPIQRGINLAKPGSAADLLPEAETEESIPAPRVANFQSLGQGLLPGDFVMAMVAIDTIMAATRSFTGDTANYTPEMCQPENGMGATLKVQAIPQIDLGGEATAFVKIGVHTSGLTASTGLTGEIKGKVGARTIEAKGNATAESPDGPPQPLAQPAENSSKGGYAGFVENIAGKLTAFAAKGEPKPAGIRTTADVVDRVTGSGVEFEMKLKLVADALKLKAVSSSPDLELELAKFEATLSLKVKGIIDLIELAVAILAPAAVSAVQRARTAAAKGEFVRGEAKCDVSLSAEGSITQKYDSGFTYLYSANAESGFKRGESGGSFGGKVQVTGDAEISIHAEMKVWVVQAQAGARGAIHTAWVWEMRKHEGKRQKRYYFEGLRARAVAYAGVGLEQDDSAPIGTPPPETDRSTPGLSSDRSASGTQELIRLGGQATENWNAPSENEKVLLEPTVPRVTSSNPAWEDY